MKQEIVFVCLGFLFGNVLAQNNTERNTKTGSPSGRVINGTLVSIEKFPFVLNLRYFDRVCGASVITDKHALTAAHCLESIEFPEALILVGGSSDLRSGHVFAVIDYKLHPSYRNLNYDAAVVTINDTFSRYENIAPISLQTQELTYSADNPTWCYVVGWGKTDGQANFVSEILHLAWTQIISEYTCQKKLRVAPIPITSQMICAAIPNASPCKGDSGGPLVCNGQLTGIISWGENSCTTNYPDVYVKVSSSSIRAFIKDVAGI